MAPAYTTRKRQRQPTPPHRTQHDRDEVISVPSQTPPPPPQPIGGIGFAKSGYYGLPMANGTVYRDMGRGYYEAPPMSGALTPLATMAIAGPLYQPVGTLPSPYPDFMSNGYRIPPPQTHFVTNAPTSYYPTSAPSSPRLQNGRSNGTSRSAANGRSYANHTRPRVVTQPECIDLTLSPDSSGSAPKPKRRKKEHDMQNLLQQPTYVPNHLAAVSSRVSDGSYGSYSSTSARPQQPPQPIPATVLAPCDDKEGHYIVTVNEDLTPRFKILRLLGQGTFGKVVEAFDRHTRERVAIKIIRAIQKYRDASKIEIKVLNALKARDPQNTKRCIHLSECFDYRNHICMVFELLSQSVFDFLKENSFMPFPTWQIRSFAAQILEAVAFLHDLRLIHTDLKPENLMLEDNSTRTVASSKRNGKPRKELLSTRIRLIDFGSAIFEDDYHSSVVSTRHYRAPEIILSLGWSFPCDMWSVGCILVEFFTGDALFQTHDNLEHLALMEAILGRLPQDMCRNPTSRGSERFFNKMNRVDFPNPKTKAQSRKFVKATKSLKELIRPNTEELWDFYDLVSKMLTYNPRDRITAHEALQHSFITGIPSGSSSQDSGRASSHRMSR
ncbi:Dual specificity protein kinase clk3 [Rhizophlyctis rosea]|nr:Dual specificity protein kinase clk3 [Rhizophlyctis rosea]